MSAASIVVCTWGDAEIDEVLTVARTASEAQGTDFGLLALGPLSDETISAAGRHGAATVEHVDAPSLAEFGPDAYVEALARHLSESPPRLLLFSQTFDARLVAPRLAGRCGASVVVNGLEVAGGADGPLRVTASAYGGDTRVVYEVQGGAFAIVTVAANAVTPTPAATPTTPAVQRVEIDLGGVQERITVVRRPHMEGPRLEDAEVIVAGGRGLGSKENFALVEELAHALGGMAGASRPIVDDGWVDSSRQVGLTGKIARPGLYVAAGISGASQHMVGCSAAKTIVAINTDAEAAIFQYARYGLVGNCLEILPELTRAVKEA